MFSIEGGPNPEKQENKPKLHIESQYDDFLPEDFKDNPRKYIEDNGENIKSGEIKYHADGNVREDPTASKFLPEWRNNQGETIQPVSKRVNLEKVEDPLLEYKIMSLCQVLDLPFAKPIGFVEQGNDLFILMERVKGYT